MVIVEALSELITYDTWVHAVSGAVSAGFSIFVLYPLDTVRTRLQVEDGWRSRNISYVLKTIIKDEGFNGLYRGFKPMMVTTFCSYFVFFYAYNGMKSMVFSDSMKPDPTKDLIISFVAGVINCVSTAPLWTASMRFKFQGAKLHTKKDNEKLKAKYSGILDALTKIYREEGIAALWKGTFASIILSTNPAIQFMTYEFQKRYIQKIVKSKELSGAMYFMMGGLAKLVATLITYPIQVIQSRQRAKFANDSSRSVFSAFMNILRTSGIGGLYRGLESKLVQTILTSSLMFLCYEKVVSFVYLILNAKQKRI